MKLRGDAKLPPLIMGENQANAMLSLGLGLRGVVVATALPFVTVPGSEYEAQWRRERFRVVRGGE